MWISRVDIEFVFQYVHPDTGAWFQEERVIGVREETNYHLKIYQRDVTKGLWCHLRHVLLPWRQRFFRK